MYSEGEVETVEEEARARWTGGTHSEGKAALAAAAQLKHLRTTELRAALI